MKSEFTDEAEEEFYGLDKSLQEFFRSHINKISNMPPRGHLKHGLPFFKEDVTKQARLVYVEEGGTILIIHCFATHKEYEKWYQSYR